MKNEESIISSILLKKEFTPYTKYEETPCGSITTINIPNKYDIQLKTYKILPGITLIIDKSNISYGYNDKEDTNKYLNPDKYLIINYIMSGHCQIRIGPDKYMFMKEKDIAIYHKALNPFELNYTGKMEMLHIIINRDLINDEISYYYNEYTDMVTKLFEISSHENFILFKSSEKINSIVEEILSYEPKNINSKILHLQLKTLEILLDLYQSDIKDEKIEQRTYTDSQIRVVRSIKNSLSRDITTYISLEVLSASYGINLTTLKNCFKDMYGKPLYSWYREYKFYRARELVKNTDYPISKIAHMIGYKSSSKFSKAFKQETGVLPSVYRKTNKHEK